MKNFIALKFLLLAIIAAAFLAGCSSDTPNYGKDSSVTAAGGAGSKAVGPPPGGASSAATTQ